MAQWARSFAQGPDYRTRVSMNVQAGVERSTTQEGEPCLLHQRALYSNLEIPASISKTERERGGYLIPTSGLHVSVHRRTCTPHTCPKTC